MKTVVDSRLREQARRFELRFACDDCVHFQPSDGPSFSSSSGCSLAYPAAPRRDALTAQPSLEFCKSFELA
jgi:hypothetical protein